jgi:DNA uptake protein ComE-like DNA-binding protein
MQGRGQGAMRKAWVFGVTVRVVAMLGLCAALAWVASCNANGKPESDQQIQQQAQQATENAKRAADKAAAEARVAAANAEREANDVAAGVKAGIHNGKGGSGVDLNSATRADLETLPGVTVATARRIEANRPYGTPHDLVRKGVVSESEYDRIAGDVVTR